MSTIQAQPNYSSGNDRFDNEAATWDTKPEVVLSSRLCLSSILSNQSTYFPCLSTASILEIGCGTGLLTVPLSQHVESVLALDTAAAMIDMLNAKILLHSLESKVTTKVKLLEDPNDPLLQGKKFDLALSHLVFHHVPDMGKLVQVVYDTLKSGGRIWISDFEHDGPQAEAFHPKHKASLLSHSRASTIKSADELFCILCLWMVKQHAGVERHGLERREMKEILETAGFDHVEVFESFKMDKQVDSGETQSFPFLAITGVRP